MSFMKKARYPKMKRFNNEERQVLNRMVRNQSIQELTKESVLKDLKLSRDIMTNEEGFSAEIKMQEELLNELIQSVEAMEQSEWEKIKMLFPLPTVTDEVEDVEFMP